jgi:uncharacterized membrane protein YagU involved in acid resistance
MEELYPSHSVVSVKRDEFSQIFYILIHLGYSLIAVIIFIIINDKYKRIFSWKCTLVYLVSNFIMT